MIHMGPKAERAEVTSTPAAFYAPWPGKHASHIITISSPGTGGNSTIEFFRERRGYQLFPLEEQPPDPPVAAVTSFADLMLEVKSGFGRTITRLPVVFGVSRQTLYNWLKGETPKDSHQTKLIELAAAARTFSAAHFTPTAPMLDQTVSHGKSFLALLAEGADGTDTANGLMRIVNRSRDARARLEAALAGHPKARPTVSDMGAPAFDEDRQ